MLFQVKSTIISTCHLKRNSRRGRAMGGGPAPELSAEAIILGACTCGAGLHNSAARRGLLIFPLPAQPGPSSLPSPIITAIITIYPIGSGGEPAGRAVHPLRRAGVHCRRGHGVHAVLGESHALAASCQRRSFWRPDVALAPHVGPCGRAPSAPPRARSGCTTPGPRCPAALAAPTSLPHRTTPATPRALVLPLLPPTPRATDHNKPAAAHPPRRR